MGFKETFNSFFYGDADNKETEQDNDFDTVDGYDTDEVEEVSNQANSSVSVSSSSIEMIVVKPEKLETVTQIADYLVDRKTILLNLEDTSKETARRLIDFLNGVAYAINGDLRKVASNTYVVTPSNVALSGEKLKESAEAAFSRD